MNTNKVLEVSRAGDPTFQFALAILYWLGAGVERNKKTAINWMKQAADAGCDAAQYGLCLLLEESEKEKEASLKSCEAAANAGFAPAQLHLGVSYQCGIGVKKDDDVAVKWIKLAADQHYTPAMHHLALLHLDGMGVPATAKWR